MISYLLIMKIKRISSSKIHPLLIGIILTTGIISCKSRNYTRNSTHQNVSYASIEKGRQLAQMFCQSCHMLPSPSLLDANTWEKGVLPQMAPRLGIFNYGLQNYPRSRDMEIGKDFYPSHPEMSLSDWQNIMDYYEATSPDSLPHQKRNQPIKTGLPLFEVLRPEINYQNPATCYLKILSSDSSNPIIIGDVIKRDLLFFDKNLKAEDSVKTGGPIVDINFNKKNMLALDIGVLNPNNGKFGKVEVINHDSKGHLQKDSVPLIENLQRPVQVTTADLNNDGKPDYLVCEFGYLTGGLTWFENEGNGQFKKHVLRNVPGAITAYVQDYNHDGLPDIWVLFAQGEEGIFL